ncbi:MAG TPA: MBL fold metallo-hydrolase [Chloroflexota bacterium]|nr:MBL fold metallo-hydrolase [Chloroflexota bacterium]
MFLRMLYNQQLAQASYLVGCAATGEALVVDPNRDLDQYFNLAAREGFRIAAVTETHIHADFVSGARELAARSGARLYLSGEGPAAWQYTYAGESGATLVHQGDLITVGNIHLEVLHTPGHTPEHIAFLLTDAAHADKPMGIFTGDFVFVGDVGRPDLLERAAGYGGTMADSARQLYASLQRFPALPDYLQVWPGHGAGSACGKALGAVPQSTVGYETRFNWAFQVHDEDEFIERVLAGQPNPPAYFARMKQVNKEGPIPRLMLPAPQHVRLNDLLEMLGEAVTVVDTRPADAYAGGHLPGTINIPMGASFVTWAGWLLPDDHPFALIVDDHEADIAARQLGLIGLDALAGYATSEVFSAWSARGRELATLRRIDPAGLSDLLRRDEVEALDVREPSEVALGAIAGSRAIPLGYLPRRLADLPRDRTLVVYCQSGMRSSIAASLLAAAGHQKVIDLVGGFDAWQRHQ